MSRVLELKRKYRDLVGSADEIRKQYTNTDKTMTDDEATRFDAIMEDADKLWADIEREEKAERLQRLDETPASKVAFPDDQKAERVKDLQTKAFRAWLAGGFGSDGYERASAELKGLQADLDTSGGYLVAPQLFVQQLLQDVDDAVVMRPLSTKIPLAMNESLGVPSLDTDLNDADWTTELQTGSVDTATRFGKRELRPHPFAKRVKVSNKLIRSALIDPEVHVRQRLAYKFSVTEDKAFLTGSGALQPLGVFTASALGVSTSRDVTCGTTTEITADGLIDVAHGLKPQYWGRARWLMHRDALKQIRKLKDGNGQYLWQAGLAGGIPATILDSPYLLSEYAPNTFTTGLYVVMYADFSFYWIADALGLQIQRVTELYAETNETGFIGRAECDGMPVLENAFSRGKLA